MTPFISRALVVGAALIAAPLYADQAARLTLTVGEGELINLSAPAATVFVADPSVADVQVAGPSAVFVFGAASGRTTFYALDEDGRPLARRDVIVQQDLALVRRMLSERFPGLRLRLNPGPRSVMVSGTVRSAEQAEAVIQSVAGAVAEGERVINQLKVAEPSQVTLRVRIAEVSRNVDERLGINWGAVFDDTGGAALSLITGRALYPNFNEPTGVKVPTDGYSTSFGRVRQGAFDINMLLDAMNREGLARVLAEPNLTAISGQTASFLAGGEFPIPVESKDDKVTIEYKQFGVMLDFTPTVLSADRISLRVRPEVSDLTDRGAVKVNDISVPGITVRRVDTTVELASGQSLVIGGLLQQDTREQVEKVPGLGELPVLGALFTSSKYLSNETELLVTVTPYLVQGVAPEALSSPISPRNVNNSLEALLARRAGVEEPSVALNGPVGFGY